MRYFLKLNLSNDLKLLNNLSIDGMTPINIRTVSTYPLTPIKDVSFILFLLTNN
jgi:hypothetical protein